MYGAFSVVIWQLCCLYLHLNCFNPVLVQVLFSRSLSISAKMMRACWSHILTVLRQAVLLVNISSRYIHRKLICLLHTGWQQPCLHGGRKETLKRNAGSAVCTHTNLPLQRGPQQYRCVLHMILCKEEGAHSCKTKTFCGVLWYEWCWHVQRTLNLKM